MKSREEYDNIINDLRTKLGDNFSLISDTIAELSTDYDGVIQAEQDFKNQIDNLKNEKVQLLETNNKLFTQITNKSEEKKDPVFEKEQMEIDKENKLKNVDINNVLDEKGGLN